jgi:Na+-transporting NADH:ubiquinone oxidoreductase subunit F
MNIQEIILAIAMFTGIVLALAMFILMARKKLVSSGDVTIDINGGHHNITTAAGGKLLQTLAENEIFLSSACGGAGTCAQCKCIVESGGGEILPTEAPHFSKREARAGGGWPARRRSRRT